VAVAAIVVAAAGCGPAEPTGSREVSVYVFSESVPSSVLASFSASTGIKVDATYYETNEELVAALRARPTAYDLVMPSDYTVDQLIKDGALRPLDLARIPNYANIKQEFLSPYFDPGGLAVAARGRGRNEKYSLPWLWGTTGIAYDTTQVSPAPKAWTDLWNPAHAGHLVLLDDAREMFGIALVADGHSKNSTDPAHLAAAKARLDTLVKGAVALDANSSETAFADGRATIGAVFSGNAAIAMRSNPNIAYVLPEEGGGIWFDNLAIPARARHPDAATALIDYLLSADAGLAVMKELSFSNPNEAAIARYKADNAAAYEAWGRNVATNPPQDALSELVMVKNVGPENNALFEKAWADVVAGFVPPQQGGIPENLLPVLDYVNDGTPPPGSTPPPGDVPRPDLPQEPAVPPDKLSIPAPMPPAGGSK
jgi:spermidine/putrescine-binding protein